MSEQAERLFEQALALEPAARSAYVENASSSDSQLRVEVMSLLEESDNADEFFDRLGAAVFASSFSIDGDDSPRYQPQDPVLPEGHVVGHYRIVSLIGSGGMGTVYRAHDTRLHRDVALKFLPSSLGAEPDAQERLLIEARAVAALNHPNVCSIHEIGESDDNRLFIAMPCYEGVTLKEQLRRGAMSVPDSVATAIQITRGLAAAHARGIVHRDVKPGNVMLGSDGTVRLLDFGLAIPVDANRKSSGSTRGTVAYMSPEQARDDALDQRTDLWSLGVLLYEMLAGVRPFRGANAPAVLQAIFNENPEPISKRCPEIVPALERIVDRLLQKDPANRHASAAAVLADLEQALPSDRTTSRRSFFSRRGTVVTVTLMLLLLVIGLPAWRNLRDESLLNRSATNRARPSIAVLPLANLGPDSPDAALATGMTEELITTLASAGDVRVIASTSVAALKGREIDVRKIADTLGVSNILEGALQKIGSRVHVQVRLVDGKDGATRWSQSYDREFKETFAVQEEIARAVIGELGLRFDRDRQFARQHPRNIAAYELYLRGSDPILLRSQSGIWKAEEYFNQAIAIDSTYAAAHAGLAIAYVRRARNASDPGVPPLKLLALAESEARKAIALDATLAEAHYSLGRVLEATLDFPAARTAIRRAIALDPSRSVYRKSLSHLQAWSGGPEEVLAEARRALETDPLNPYALSAVASGLYGMRRYDEALAQLQSLAAVEPPLQVVSFAIAQVYGKKQMLPEAIAALRPAAEAGDPLFQALLGHMLARAGQRDEASRILADLITRQKRTGGGAFQVAIVHAGFGDLDQTFEWLDKAIDDRSINSFIMGPTFDDLHRDPRFQRFRARLKLQKA
ncbi:MAG: protein kinase [Gemmatimonadaceae bacterium]